jgi:hypothetical protein
MGFTLKVATANNRRGAPGNGFVGLIVRMAGRGGRSVCLGFTLRVATAFVNRAPGSVTTGFTKELAGRGGRRPPPDFKSVLATAKGIEAPGKREVVCME